VFSWQSGLTSTFAYLRPRETIGTRPPIDNLRLIDLVTRVGGGGQARRVTNGAVYIDRLSAGATDQMVVVVTNPIFIESRRPSGLDASDEALLGQHPKGVVHRLSRDGTDLGANVLGDGVRRAVRSTQYRSQNGQSLGRDLDTVLTKEVV